MKNINKTTTKRILIGVFFVVVIIVGYLTSSCSKKDKKEDTPTQNEVVESQQPSIEFAELQNENEALREENHRLTVELQNISNSHNNTPISEVATPLPTTEPQLVQMEAAETSENSLPVASDENLYLNIKFWEDGKNYKFCDDSQSWYTDPNLSQEGSGSPVIVSPVRPPLTLDCGPTVYHLMSSQGLIFTYEYPSIEEIEAPDEILHASIDSAANAEYLSLLFYGDGNFRRLYEDSEQYWYGDCSLLSKIPNSMEVRITSVHPDFLTLKSGIEVYSSLAENGTVVWMHEYPGLEILE